MVIRAALKSPLVFGGAGLISAGGLGVGSGQVYEEFNPTLDKQLSRKKYSYSLFNIPNETKPKNKRFDWKGWDCINRLFPKVEVKYDDVSGGSGSNSMPSHATPSQKVEKFVTCAIMEMKPITPNDAGVDNTKFKNRIYFKSEVAVKGENYGWIMWTGLSTFPKKDSGKNYYENNMELVYKLLELKREEGSGVAKEGYSGNNFKASVRDDDDFVIAPPMEQDKWFPKDKPRKYKDVNHFEKRVWAGIGEVDETSSDEKLKDLLGSISVYFKSDAELGGGNRDFNVIGVGYKSAHYFYDKNSGGKDTTTSKTTNIAPYLKGWYAPFKNKKIRGSNGKDKCDAFSRRRIPPKTPVDGDIQKLCYQKQ